MDIKAGDIGITEHQIFRDSYQLIRILKPGKTMHFVQTWRMGEWDEPSRRKVTVWVPLPDDVDCAKLMADIRSLKSAHDAAVNDARIGFEKGIQALAKDVPTNGH